MRTTIFLSAAALLFQAGCGKTPAPGRAKGDPGDSPIKVADGTLIQDVPTPPGMTVSNAPILVQISASDYAIQKDDFKVAGIVVGRKRIDVNGKRWELTTPTGDHLSADGAGSAVYIHFAAKDVSVPYPPKRITRKSGQLNGSKLTYNWWTDTFPAGISGKEDFIICYCPNGVCSDVPCKPKP